MEVQHFFGSHVAESGRLEGAEEIVERFERISVGAHPFFARLQREPVNLSAIWLLMANLREGISGHFVRWLARTIERTDDPRVACFIAKQLNDELGGGEPTQVHAVLLDDFVAGLEPWRSVPLDPAVLQPGRTLADVAGRPFFGPDVNEALGALTVGEIFAKKMDHALGDEIRRQDKVDDLSLRWLHIHEVLEADHADEVAELAKLIPRSRKAVEAAWRGAVQQWDALWNFLDEVNALSMAHGVRCPAGQSGDCTESPA